MLMVNLPQRNANAGTLGHFLKWGESTTGFLVVFGEFASLASHNSFGVHILYFKLFFFIFFKGALLLP